MGNPIVTKNRTSLVSNEVFDKHRYHLSLNGQKVLYGLAQCIDHSEDMFREFEIDIRGLFEYLGVENRNDRYNVVREAFEDIVKNPLMFKHGPKKWSGFPWLSYEFNEEEGVYVKVSFTEKIKPFLLGLNGYIKVKGKYICNLSSTYAAWLYPVMKMVNEKYYGEHVISIQRLKELTFTDDPNEHPSYNKSASANSMFIRRVLGMRRDPDTGEWVYAKGKKSKFTPIEEINEKTDLNVSIEVLKTGSKYDRVRFYVTMKDSTKKKKRFGPGGSSNERQYTLSLGSPEKMKTSVPIKHVYEYAKAAGMSVQEYLKRTGYYQKGDRAYRKAEKHLREAR